MVPALSPLTTPVNAPTVATGVAEQLQVPPGVEPVNVVVPPAHRFVVPVIGPIAVSTVTVVVILHPVPRV